jgi:hypothetical protein
MTKSGESTAISGRNVLRAAGAVGVATAAGALGSRVFHRRSRALRRRSVSPGAISRRATRRWDRHPTRGPRLLQERQRRRLRSRTPGA